MRRVIETGDFARSPSRRRSRPNPLTSPRLPQSLVPKRTRDLVRDVVSDATAPQSLTASRSATGARPGPRRSRQVWELACAASWAEPAITENTHPDVLHRGGTRDDALILDWRHSARGDERT